MVCQGEDVTCGCLGVSKEGKKESRDLDLASGFVEVVAKQKQYLAYVRAAQASIICLKR